ncbi:MAG: hypothetical protein FJ263_01520 [Planctomycetes bacterium]|nr:hypothetical protein [Planctomycetota bacterium]
MKKVLYSVLSVLAGILTAVILYEAIIFLVITPWQRATGREPEAFLGLIFMVIMPVILFLSSMLTGFLVSPLFEKSFIRFFFCMPALYTVAMEIVFSFSNVNYMIMITVPLVINLVISYIGVVVGYKLKRRRNQVPA